LFRNVLVTGGGSGIGAAIVTRLEREGASVEVLDLRDGFDVADVAAWERVGPVDLACLNAGVLAEGDDLAAYRRITAVNVDGVVFGVWRLAEIMKAGSAIVATASLAGLVPAPSDPLYTLTKHAVVGFVRAVAPRLAGRGIRINMVCPGFADTPMLTAEMREALGDFPLLRPEEVAEAVVRAARSEETGQAWVVQPGREPVVFRFPNVPGPAGGRRPPI
jgi:NAD(P)-dependent dehydrogenase (short-subunit alcohol dehydrogenase family)